MKKSTKIIGFWAIFLLLYSLSLTFSSHSELNLSTILSGSIQVLLMIVSIFIVKNEPNKKNKFLFLNFAAFFSISFFLLLGTFIGKSLWTGEKFALIYYFQYHTAIYTFFLSLAVVYLVVDLLFHNFKVYQKYLSTLLIVLSFFAYYYHPIVEDPLYLYSTEDIKQWKSLADYTDGNGGPASADIIAQHVTLQAWKDGRPVGILNEEENQRRIEELLPYLEHENYIILLLKPLYLNMIRMSVLSLGFIMLFFGYQYKKDPPQGAYIDKIMFTCLLFISIEIVHYWGFIKSIEWNSMLELVKVGEYVTIFFLGVMVVFFSMRLRFITSIQGEFYETELALNPQKVTRWRDAIDNLVLAKFFSLKAINGRLFQQTNK